MTLSKMAKSLGLGAAVVAFSAGAAFAATATASVNVRTGPGTSYRAIDTLSPGERVSVTDRSGGWCEINQRGPDGWVSCRYLTGDNSYRGNDRYYDDEGPSVSLQFGFGNAYPRLHRPYWGWPWMGYPHGSGFGFSYSN